MILQDAGPGEVDEVLARTHAIWSDGLDLPAYKEYVATLMQSDWARTPPGRYRFLVLREAPEGPVVAALKLYRLDLRLEGTDVAAGGVGAVFTMPDHRRRGHAAALIARVHEMMASRGDRLSLLFSEIGAGYYEERGYRALPDRAIRLPVPGAGSSGPAGVRRMRKSDIDWIAALRRSQDADADVAVVRDRDYWGYLLARASMPTLWRGPESWESRLMIAEGRGYLWSHFSRGEEGGAARLLEAAETRPGAALPVLLDDLFAECRRRGIGEVEAWPAPGLRAAEPRLEAARPAAPGETSKAARPMWAPLDPAIAPVLEKVGPAAAFQLADVF